MSNIVSLDHEIMLLPLDRKSTRLNSSHITRSRMPSSAWKKRAQRYLSNCWTNKSQSWFMPPNNLPSKNLKGTFIITQLRSDIWCPQSTPPISGSNIISWSKEPIFDIYLIWVLSIISSPMIQISFIKWFINSWLGNV